MKKIYPWALTAAVLGGSVNFWQEIQAEYLLVWLACLGIFGYYLWSEYRHHSATFACNRLQELGMLGTITGMIFAMIPLKDMVLTSADEAAKVITTLAPGIGIALATTFVGIGLSLLRDEDK